MTAIGFPHCSELGQQLAARLRGRKPTFVCVLGHTDTCLIPGISAAGATPALRALTPAADAEVLVYGQARCLSGVPCNPLGPPGPAIITRAALELASMSIYVVDAGTRVRPQTPALVLGTEPGRCITSGRAVPHATTLFQRGRALGRRLAIASEYLVLGESVPGGTTTALAVLQALGYAAQGRVSSSFGENNHGLKSEVVRRALEAADLSRQSAVGRVVGSTCRVPTGSPALEVLARVGDPMQPAMAGLALGALERCPVLLAGGTQMVAVLAAMRSIAEHEGHAVPWDRLAVTTTRWVVDDPTSDFVGLLDDVAPVAALSTTLSFASSRHASLRQYESFLVKEGVGAGGAAVAAALYAGIDPPALLGQVECVYERLEQVS